MAKRRSSRVIKSPLPPFGEVFVKSGWCRGWEWEKDHQGCRFEFYSDMTNKIYICNCDCHDGRERLIKEKP